MKNLLKFFLLSVFTIMISSFKSEANYARICSVNCDSNNVVEIIFIPADSSLSGSVLKYELYRKSNQQTNWQLVDFVLRDSLTIFHDSVSSPNDSNNYQILTIDTNGLVLDSSLERTYIHLYCSFDSTNNILNSSFFITANDTFFSGFELWAHNEFTGFDYLITTTGCCSSLAHTLPPFYFSNTDSTVLGGLVTFYVKGSMIDACSASNKNSTTNYSLSNFKLINFPVNNTPNLVAHYPLNGNADDLINSNNGVLHGGTWVSDSLGNNSSALQLNGTSDWVEFNQNPIIQNQSFTLTMWVKLNVLDDNLPFVSLGYNGIATEKEVSFGSNQLSLYTGNYYQNSSNLKRVEQYPKQGFYLSTTKWYFVSLVYSDTNSVWFNTNMFNSIDSSYKFYINGVRVNSVSNPSTWINNPFSNSTPFPLNNKMAFGVSQGECNTKNHLNGLLDEIKIYTGELSPQEIMNEYTNSMVGFNEIEVNDFKIYPNPSSGIFNLHTKSNVDYMILDSLGKTILKGKTLNNTIDLSGNVPGLYLLKIKDSIKLYKLILN